MQVKQEPIDQDSDAIIASGRATNVNTKVTGPIELRTSGVYFGEGQDRLFIPIDKIDDQKVSKADPSSAKILWQVGAATSNWRFDFRVDPTENGGADAIVARSTFRDAVANILAIRQASAPPPLPNPPPPSTTPQNAAELARATLKDKINAGNPVAAAAAAQNGAKPPLNPTTNNNNNPNNPNNNAVQAPLVLRQTGELDIPLQTLPSTEDSSQNLPPAAHGASGGKSSGAAGIGFAPGAGGAIGLKRTKSGGVMGGVTDLGGKKMGAAAITKIDISRKAAIERLKEKRKPRKLWESYEEMVLKKKIISDEEFWSMHEEDVLREIGRRQPQGLSSHPDAPHTFIGGGKRIIINQDMITALFAQHPALRKAYRELVLTDKVSEEDFWNQVASCTQLYSSGNINTAQSHKADAMFDSYLKTEEKTKETMRQRLLKDIDADTDLTRAIEMPQHGFGTIMEELTADKYLGAEKRFRDVCSKYNWHSMCAVAPDVLTLMDDDDDEPAAVKRQRVAPPPSLEETEQLRPQQQQRTIPLRLIKERQQPSSNNNNNGGGGGGGGGAAAASNGNNGAATAANGSVHDFLTHGSTVQNAALLHTAVAAWDVKRARTLVTSETARASLVDFQSLCRHVEKPANTPEGDRSFLLAVQTQYEKVREKLRFFWKNSPPPNEERAKKVDKVAADIKNQQYEITNLLTTPPEGLDSRLMSAIFQPLLTAIETAVKSWEDEKKNRRK